MHSYIGQIRAQYYQAVRYNVTGMERKEPEAISNGTVIVIRWRLIVLIQERLQHASADQ